MKWIDELEKIKSPDPKPKPIGVDDPNSFLWGVKNHTDKTDKTPTTEKGGNENGYPIPTTEDEFAMDERQAIIQFDGGQDTQPVEYPVEVKMESAILGAADLRAVHRIKKSFDGAVVPSAEVTKFKPVIRR